MLNQFYLLLLHFGFIIWTNAEPLVTFSQGTLNGTIQESRNGRKFAAFLGIPYGKPPIKDLRFANPVAAEKWKGIRQAYSFGNACPQFVNNKIIGNEDCLFLNVYTPLLRFDFSLSHQKPKLPVMLFIHGGAFIRGSSDCCRPTYLLDKDVIFVIMNYRVDILGFLTTGDASAPGNFGLKDQALALTWVQNNIHAFGGDSNRVTLFGQSAGGVSTALHALSTSTNGLFQKYIIQSGSPLGDWTFTKSSNILESAKKIAPIVSCAFNTSASFITCLRTKSVESLINAKNILSKSEDKSKISWLPTNEPEIDGAFLTDSPRNLIDQNKMKDLPFMTGCVTDEALAGTAKLYINPSKYSFIASHLDQYIRSTTETLIDSTNEKKFTAAAKQFYFNKSIDVSNKDKFIRTLTDFTTDAQFLYPELRMIEKVAPKIKSPIYFYSFGYRGRVTLQSGIENNRNLGVGHGADTVYIFPFSATSVGLPELNFTAAEQSISDLLIDVLTSFAANGKPRSKQLKRDDFWVPYNTQTTKNLQIGNIYNNTDPTVTLSNTYFLKRMNFWKKNAPI